MNETLSPTLVKLKDKNTGKLFKNPVHLDRLKIAFVRAPNPTNYFIQEPTVANETEHDIQHVRSEYCRWWLNVTIGKGNHHWQDIGTNGDQ